jgi:hypothetical protein
MLSFESYPDSASTPVVVIEVSRRFLQLLCTNVWSAPSIISRSLLFHCLSGRAVRDFLSTDPEIRVRFLALPDFLRSSGSGTESTQPRQYNWGATWKKSSGPGLENRECSSRDPSRWPRGTSIHKSWRSVKFARRLRPRSSVHYSRSFCSETPQPYRPSAWVACSIVSQIRNKIKCRLATSRGMHSGKPLQPS